MCRIETQNLFFEDPNTVRRYIEVGPSQVLANMARKTVRGKFSSQDKSRLTGRQILSYDDDSKTIYYEYEENHGTTAPLTMPTQSNNQPTMNVHVPGPITSATPLTVATGKLGTPVTLLEDMPLSATDVVLAITAKKLKRPFDEVSLQKSLRDLSGGTVFFCCYSIT